MSVRSIHPRLRSAGRRAAAGALFPSLAAASGMLVAVQLLGALLDCDRLSTPDDLSAAPMIMVIASAFAIAAPARRRSDNPMAPFARLFAALRPGFDTRSLLCNVMRELRLVAGARGATAVLENRRTGRLLQVDVTAGAGGARTRLAPVDRGAKRTYFFDWPAASGGRKPQSGTSDRHVRVVAVDRRRSFVPAAFRDKHAFQVLYAVAFHCGDDWNGRLFLFDPDHKETTRHFIRTLEQMLRRLLPAAASICDVYSMKRRAAARERARIARELHDGVVQSLIAVDVELELLRRAPIERAAATPEKLQHIQERLRTQVRGLRALLQEARAQEIEPSRLAALLAEVVRRFNQEWGVRVDYACDVRDLRLPSAVCGEVVRILQEALVNVGRHSGARSVVVRFLGNGDNVTLEVEDDGRGFQHAIGTADVAPVPAVIADRVRAIGGRVDVTSSERGTRVTMTLSREGPWTAESSAS